MKSVVRLLALATLAAPIAASAEDAVRASPGASQVMFENAYIRVVRSHFAPGAREGRHTHPAGWYYVTRGGALKVTGADGKSETWTAATGHSEWSDGEGLHTAQNRGKSPMEYLLVEVKAAPTEHPN